MTVSDEITERDETTVSNEVSGRSGTIDSFLEKLAARTAAPAGGAAAALNAAQAAALLAMVARYTTGPKYEAASRTVERVIREADQLRAECTDLIAADAAAFGSVAAAYRLPKETADQQAVRSAAIAAALVTASEPPAAVIAAAARLLDLAEALAPVGNRTVLGDLAAAADAIRAATSTSRVLVEANLAGISDTAARDLYGETVARVDRLLARADAVTSAVRADLQQ
ncbi:MAG TPA: cyclodeaminase/cyclohydrolase family protein [Streptosporangiaceae bacterium]|jgi:formiminotetrahydrofolate cyclodeaminase|nr:cyclodeaminase/cyclohydrolase family protein [Streptosporangiaceae bacterium]